MNTLQKIYALAATLLLAVLPLAAQNVVYSCDFENPTDVAAWTKNISAPARPITFENKWYIGPNGQFGAVGQNGLYVSNDSVHTTYLASGASFVTASVNLPNLTAGATYTIRFDYRVAGSTGSKLHAWWAPANFNPYGNASAAPNYTTRGGVQLAQNLYNAPTWRPYSTTFTAPALPATATTGQLVFIWETAQGNPAPPAACIDNIVIFEGNSYCAPAPTNLKYAQGAFTWSPVRGATGYEVTAYNSNTGQFIPVATVTTPSWTSTIPGSGTCIIYVRAICADGNKSEWAWVSKFMYDPSDMCIDYLDLGPDATHTGTTYIGEHASSSSHNTLQWQLGIRDNDPDDLNNLHGIHTLQGEYDPIVGSVYPLKTIPDGSIASVRLGSLYDPGQNARVEYKYHVTPGKDLLDFKYAIVLEDGYHNQDNPFVKLEILDGRGQVLESSCTQFEFVAAFGTASGWRTASLPTPGSGPGATWSASPIYWQDWDSVTVSLRPYMGQTLTIRVTASRCVFDTHITYCYFAFGCRSGAIEGLSCGDTSTDHFTAPAGFNYKWYKESDPTRANIQSTDPTVLPYANNDTLHISQTDTAVYMLECHNVNDYTCFTTVPLNPNPRYPKVEAMMMPKEADCSNDYTFKSDSYVEIITRNTTGKRDTIRANDEYVDDVIWNWGDGSPEQHTFDTLVTHSFPRTGGIFQVSVKAVMANGDCEDVQTFDVSVPDLTLGTVDLTETVCRASYPVYTFRGEKYSTDTVITWDTTSVYGCEVTNTMTLKFSDAVVLRDTATICEGNFIEKWGKRFMTTGLDSVFAPVADEFGCDSVYYLNLTVNPLLDFKMADFYTICPEDGIKLPFTVPHGDYTDVRIVPSAAAVREGFEAEYLFAKEDLTDGVMRIAVPGSDGDVDDFFKAGNYTFTVEPHSLYPECSEVTIPVTLEVRYSNSIIVQRGNYLMLYAADKNGGYDNWVSYQWYQNNEPMVGYTSSQMIMPDTTSTTEYYCLITDAEGHTVATCPVSYQQPKYVPVDNLTTVSVNPTLLGPGEPIFLGHGGYVELFDALGRKVLTQQTEPTLPDVLMAPAQPGIYMLRIGSSVTRIIVK